MHIYALELPAGDIDMQIIPRDNAKKFALDWRDEAQLNVRPGESFEIKARWPE